MVSQRGQNDPPPAVTAHALRHTQPCAFSGGEGEAGRGGSRERGRQGEGESSLWSCWWSVEVEEREAAVLFCHSAVKCVCANVCVCACMCLDMW